MSLKNGQVLRSHSISSGVAVKSEKPVFRKKIWVYGECVERHETHEGELQDSDCSIPE